MKHKCSTTKKVIFIVPILAVLFLAFIVSLHNETLSANSQLENAQFIIMPRNCYLKVP